jgi:ectoine hydroxylase-related dioxygenase (phytanoyl-CoA dioxygenase family)
VSVNDEEQYFFDLQGYLVVDDVLSPDEVAGLNRLIDAAPDRAAHAPAYQWDEAFRRLIDHPKVLPYLVTLVGPTVRLDHDRVVVAKPGQGGAPVRGGAEPYDDVTVFHFQCGRMFNALVTVSFALTDDDGALLAVPGSHKSNYPFPDEWRDLAAPGPWLRPVPQQAGSALIYTEALAYGVAAASVRERRAVRMTYAPGAMAAARPYPRPDDVAEAAWSDRQRAMLEPPYFQNRSFVTTL